MEIVWNIGHSVVSIMDYHCESGLPLSCLGLHCAVSQQLWHPFFPESQNLSHIVALNGLVDKTE